MDKIKVTAVNQQNEPVMVTPTAVGVSTVTGEYNTTHTYTVTRTGYVTKTGTWTATKNETINVALERQSYTLTITVPDQTKYTSGVLKIDGTAVTVSSNTYTGTFKYLDSVKIEYSANGIETYTNTITIPYSNVSVNIANLANYIEYDIGIDREPSGLTFTYTLNGGSVITNTNNSIEGLRYNDKIVWNATCVGYAAKSNQTLTITGNTRLDVTLTPLNYSLTITVPEQTKYTNGVLTVMGKVVTVTNNVHVATIPYGTKHTVTYTANGINNYSTSLTQGSVNSSLNIGAVASYVSYTATVKKSDLVLSRPVITYTINGGSTITLPDSATTITGLRYNDKIVWNATQTGHTSKTNQSLFVNGNITIDMTLTPIKYNITVNAYSVSTSGSLITSTGTNIFILDGSGGTIDSVANKNTLTSSIDYGTVYKIRATATGHNDYSSPSTTILQVTGAKTHDIALTKAKYTLTINPTPSDATVTFS